MNNLWSEPDLPPLAPFTSPIRRTQNTTDNVTMGSDPAPPSSGRRKESRNPSVTPRRFSRFFFGDPNAIQGRRILGGAHNSSLNRRPVSPDPFLHSDFPSSDPICPSSPCEELGRSNHLSRKRSHVALEGSTSTLTPPTRFLQDLTRPDLFDDDASFGGHSSPEREDDYRLPEHQPSPTKRQKSTMNRLLRVSRGGSTQALSARHKNDVRSHAMQLSEGETMDLVIEKADQELPIEYVPKSVQKFVNRGYQAQLVDREHGFLLQDGRCHLSYPSSSDVIPHTAAYCTSMEDSYQNTALADLEEGEGDPLPFCLASCKYSPLTAIGDEHGSIRLLRPLVERAPGMEKNFVVETFQVHNNAILDIAISEDDLRLATASGDRTVCIVDIHTQTIVVSLENQHERSLRQVNFQPGRASGDVLSSSDKDGKVIIWDLRCSRLPVRAFTTWTDDTRRTTRLRRPDIRPISSLLPFNSIPAAHPRRKPNTTTKRSSNTPASASVTSLQWFPAGREHLLLSGSEANTSIKLWDTRYIRSPRTTTSTPLAQTQPPTHHAFRPYGITSIAMSQDASRFYAVSKDSTVYAYSTAHLMLGEARELLDGPDSTKRKPHGVQGLGPLYGFKHESLSVGSFFIKSALRPAQDGRCEMLAVGSTNNSPVLFATDERYMRTAWSRQSHIIPTTNTREETTTTTTHQSPFSAAKQTPSSLTPSNVDIPIYRSGTALVQGHTKEVTNVTWTFDGSLVSASDDGQVRYWRENAGRARFLRGEATNGQSFERWNAGWADVGEDWDADEEC